MLRHQERVRLKPGGGGRSDEVFVNQGMFLGNGAVVTDRAGKDRIKKGG